MPAFSQFYPVPDEEIRLEHVVQFGVGVLVFCGVAFILYTVIQAIFFPSSPGEEVTGKVATFFYKGGASPTAESIKECNHKYDYVIIGGGTAGCVLANRLTENPKVRVLLIEAGPSDLKYFYTRIPAGYLKVWGTTADYDIKTTEQQQLGGRVLAWPRGKMLGGCSSINAMIYNRGAPDTFDEWKKLGNPGWSYNDVRPYFDKSEGFKQGKYRKLKDQELQQHGKTGPWQTTFRKPMPVSDAFVDACASVGIDKIEDFNTHHGTNGAAAFQTFIDQKGQRSSTAVSYLTPAVAARPNLKISVGKIVTRIIFDTTTSEKPRAVGVEIGSSTTSALKYIAAATKEVIVCGGAIHTPHVLNLSGIGNAADLNALAIPVIKDLPAVGQNLVDHLEVNCIASVQKGSSLQWMGDDLAAIPSLLQWLWNGNGPMGGNVAEAAAFLRFQDRRDAPKVLREKDLSSGPTSSDVEIIHCSATTINHGKGPNLSKRDCTGLGAILLRPLSRGTVKLQSSSPFTPPLVDANYLSHPHDLAALVYALKLIRQLVKSPAYSSYFTSWLLPSPAAASLVGPKCTGPTGAGAKDFDNMSDGELEAFARETAETIYHPMCSARMGPDEKTAVVDARLRVHGVQGLRVADASVFPMPVACHPCAAVVMVGEKCADMVKEDMNREDVGVGEKGKDVVKESKRRVQMGQWERAGRVGR